MTTYNTDTWLRDEMAVLKRALEDLEEASEYYETKYSELEEANANLEGENMESSSAKVDACEAYHLLSEFVAPYIKEWGSAGVVRFGVSRTRSPSAALREALDLLEVWVP
jgi:hypothetical protein